MREDELGVGHVDAMRLGAGGGWESAVGGEYGGACWERFACVFVGVFAHKRDEAGEQRCDGVSECDCARGEFRACGVHGFLSGGPHGWRANHLGIGQLCSLPDWAWSLGVSPFFNHDWPFEWHCKCGLLSRSIVAESCTEGQRWCDGRSEHNTSRGRCWASPVLSSGAWGPHVVRRDDLELRLFGFMSRGSWNGWISAAISNSRDASRNKLGHAYQ